MRNMQIAALIACLLLATMAAGQTFVTIAGHGPVQVFMGPAAQYPSGQIIVLGKNQQFFYFAVRGSFQAFRSQTGGGFTDITTAGKWTSSDPTRVSIDPITGVATAVNPTVANQPVTITFASGPYRAYTLLAVVPKVLSFVDVTPQNPTIAAMNTPYNGFTATAHFSDGSTLDVTHAPSTFWFADSNNNFATASPTAGDNTITGVSPGITYVGAEYSDPYYFADGFSNMNVGMSSIVNPLFAFYVPLNVGVQDQLYAEGHFPGSALPDPQVLQDADLSFSSSVSWVSSNTNVATVDTVFGVATGVSNGTTNFTASSPGVASVTNSLMVNKVALTSISISPPTANLQIGDPQQFFATGNFKDKSTQDITYVATWNSTNPTVGNVQSFGGGGSAQAFSPGTTNITASYIDPSDGTTLITGTAVMNVAPPALQTITVSPANASLFTGPGVTLQYAATGTYSNGTNANITTQVAWASSSTPVANIVANGASGGLATIVGAGPTTISAKLSGVTGSTGLTVSAITLNSIAVTPVGKQVDVGGAVQYKATGTYSDTSTKDISGFATWNSNNAAAATINSTGLATGSGTGTANITASLGGILSPAQQLTVNGPTSVTVAPLSMNIPVGGQQQFTATAHFADTTTQNVTSLATWNSNAPTVAVVNDTNAKGLATGAGAGTANITATADGVMSAPATVNVQSGVLQSINIAPQDGTVPEGKTKQFTATGHFSDGSTRDLTTQVTWSSSEPSIAKIGANTGLASGIFIGKVNISASITMGGTFTDTTSLTVTF